MGQHVLSAFHLRAYWHGAVVPAPLRRTGTRVRGYAPPTVQALHVAHRDAAVIPLFHPCTTKPRDSGTPSSRPFGRARTRSGRGAIPTVTAGLLTHRHRAVRTEPAMRARACVWGGAASTMLARLHTESVQTVRSTHVTGNTPALPRAHAHLYLGAWYCDA